MDRQATADVSKELTAAIFTVEELIPELVIHYLFGLDCEGNLYENTFLLKMDALRRGFICHLRNY
jgi:hypothetical protein